MKHRSVGSRFLSAEKARGRSVTHDTIVAALARIWRLPRIQCIDRWTSRPRCGRCLPHERETRMLMSPVAPRRARAVYAKVTKLADDESSPKCIVSQPAH